MQFQPHTACKRRTVAQAARPAAEPCLDDARTKAAQPSSPAQRVAAPARADPKKHDVPTQTARRAPHRPSCSPPLLCHVDGRSRGSMRHSFARHSRVPWSQITRPGSFDAPSPALQAWLGGEGRHANTRTMVPFPGPLDYFTYAAGVPTLYRRRGRRRRTVARRLCGSQRGSEWSRLAQPIL